MFKGFLNLINLKEEGGIKIVTLAILAIAWAIAFYPDKVLSFFLK
jgi:hypothetical protein